ncbi:MAG TPA: nucleotidyltransferase family protein [Hanamia sp.]|nr:nucleotidyltransferase family protein [Hanamia sp.]
MYNTHQVITILEYQKKELVKKYPISEMGLFRSYARGDYNEHGDIDILVDFDGRIDGFDYIKIAHHLEDAFNQKIDLVSRKSIKAIYLPYVENNLIQV